MSAQSLSARSHSTPFFIPIDMGKLEKVQHAATRVMLPHLDYEERLQILGIPT